jgi:hypothetical protein
LWPRGVKEWSNKKVEGSIPTLSIIFTLVVKKKKLLLGFGRCHPKLFFLLLFLLINSFYAADD